MTVTFFTDRFKSKIAGNYKGHFANELYPFCSAMPGEREYQRCMFSWSKLQKLQLRAVPLQRQIGRQGGSRGDLSHPWPAGPPPGPREAPSPPGGASADQAEPGWQGWEQRGDAREQPRVSPAAVVITPLSVAQ